MFMASSSLYNIIFKRASFLEKAVSKKVAGVLIVVLIVSPVYWYYDEFIDPVLDGHYEIGIQVSDNVADVVAVDFDVSSYIEENESESYAGGYEHTTTDRYRVYSIYVNSIKLPNGRDYAINTSVEEDESLDLVDYLDDDNYMWKSVNVWPLSKSKLGITDEDIWSRQNLGSVLMPLLTVPSCAYLLYQHYLVSKKKNEESER